jgi:hypothetical protein
MENAEFEDFFAALRRGDHDVAERLVHLYGPSGNSKKRRWPN